MRGFLVPLVRFGGVFGADGGPAVPIVGKL